MDAKIEQDVLRGKKQFRCKGVFERREPADRIELQWLAGQVRNNGAL